MSTSDEDHEPNNPLKLGEGDLEYRRDLISRAYRNQAIYLDVSKIYLQISSLGLGSLWFLIVPAMQWPVYAAAVLWGITIASAIGFTFSSAKWLERVERKRLGHVVPLKKRMPILLDFTQRNPALWFNTMAVTFFLGVLAFVVSVLMKLNVEAVK